MKRFIKKILKNIKKNMLICLLVGFCTLMWIYGLILEMAGYAMAATSPNKSYIVLALTQLGEGIYPWNMNDKELNDYGFIETINLDSPTITAASINTVSANKPVAIENENQNDPTDEDLKYEYMKGSRYEIGKVPQSYFDDAVFIGDSRMEGVYEYAGIDNATFLTKVSMSIYNMLDSKVTNPDYKTVLDGLEKGHYGKVYMMVGINEIGTANADYFANHYREVINNIRELQPDAIIIIQAIMHVTPSRDETDEYFNNANINERNDALRALADGEHIFFIDENEAYDDENGNLIEEYSSDTIHLYGNKYADWKDFLMDNGVFLKGTDPFEGEDTVSDNSVEYSGENNE